MLSFFASKGGVGCSVVTAAAALLSSKRHPALLVDLTGDMPTLLGVEHSGPDLGDWLLSEHPLPDALRRIEIPVTDNLGLLTVSNRLSSLAVPGPMERLAALLAADDRHVFVDVGTELGPSEAVLSLSRRLVMVTRACFLALKAAATVPVPDELVLVSEPGRALRASDVSAAIGVPVSETVRWDPAIARAADAGLLACRLPKTLSNLERLTVASGG